MFALFRNSIQFQHRNTEIAAERPTRFVATIWLHFNSDDAAAIKISDETERLQLNRTISILPTPSAMNISDDEYPHRPLYLGNLRFLHVHSVKSSTNNPFLAFHSLKDSTMLKAPILISFLLCTASAISPSDIFNLLQQPQVATMAKDYVVQGLAGPLSELRNSICTSPLLNEDKMVGTLNRAADSLSSALGETAALGPQLQEALSYVTQVGQEMMNDPSFKPQIEALQKQLEKTLDFFTEHLDDAVNVASKVMKQ